MFSVMGIRKIDGEIITLSIHFDAESAQSTFKMYDSSKDSRGFSSIHLLKEVS